MYFFKKSKNDEKLEEKQKNSEKITGENTKKKAKAQREYFKGHICAFHEQLKFKNRVQCGKVVRLLLSLTTVRTSDIRARNIFRSYAALTIEIQQHYHSYPYSIHPFSWLRLIIETLVVLNFIVCFVNIPYDYSLTTEPDDVSENILMICEICYIFYIISNFFTGYEEGSTCPYVVLSLKKIAWKYITSWFIWDLLYVSSLVDYFAGINIYTDISVDTLLTTVKVVQIRKLFKYVDNLLTVRGSSEMTKTYVQLILICVNYILWNIYLQFAVEYIIENSFNPVSPRSCSWLTVTNMWNETSTTKLLVTGRRAVGMLRQTSNLNLLRQDACVEAFCIFSWIIAKFLCAHCGLMYMILLFGQESARARYFMMAHQVKIYLDHRRFPERLKKKVLTYYGVRYQSSYVSEQRIMSCMSGQLREDIIMHTSRQLVSEVEFLKKLPRPLLLQIATKLKVVLFLAGDIIFKINTVGDYLYFIDKGTIAIYSESGKEICHLQDGDFFGETALIRQCRFRNESAVAVTDCELFRLDRKDFERTIACYPTVYENIKTVALKRWESTKVLDDHHKDELRTKYRDESRESLD